MERSNKMKANVDEFKQPSLSAKHLLVSDNPVGYAKIVDTLSVDDVIKFNKAGMLFLFVRNSISDEVREEIKNTLLIVYENITGERVQQAISMLKKYGGRFD